ncbi:MAG: hypothetical protein ACEQSK_10475 [Sphingomonadaceae bacterium]
MRQYSILLLPLLLSACVDDSASYYVGDNSSGHALTVHRAQPHFWSKEVDVELIMSRLPECQRRVTLTTLPADEVEIELYANGDNIWTLRYGKEAWQIDTQTCTQFNEAKGDGGELIGVFRDENGKLAFAAAVSVAVPDPAPPQ